MRKHLILLMMKKLMDGKSEETNISRGTEGCRERERERVCDRARGRERGRKREKEKGRTREIER